MHNGNTIICLLCVQELLPHWKFKDEGCAEASSAKILSMFKDYKDAADFVGMDMARK